MFPMLFGKKRKTKVSSHERTDGRVRSKVGGRGERASSEPDNLRDLLRFELWHTAQGWSRTCESATESCCLDRNAGSERLLSKKPTQWR
jgi:hypothetical protein